MKTVLITGCSSGFGLETAKLFLARGWQVIATMRSPDESLLPASENLRVLPLDVTNAESIAALVEQAGEVDVLVNNAGIGFLNALEGSSLEVIRTLFETNTFGTMAMCKAFMPQFRTRQSGMFINVTSTVAIAPFPLLSVYSASKAAVNRFTETLAEELKPFNIQAKVVMPGRAPDTRFGENAQGLMQEGFPEAYQALIEGIFAGWAADNSELTKAVDVAEAVWQAATEPSAPMYLAAGADAVALYNAG
ncbi:SDR family oxidoreductase [Pokkaliibacter sp. CJK22405]|uniref:SDR family oxidoreductase n=1 Tax=Pokkaliibacter sp. CJK22405 TaxID=3384615 RepID=UPI0039852E03